MTSLNRVSLIGNLGRDPEVRRTNSGNPIVNLRVATSETWRDKASGERMERTEWHQVVVFNESLCKVIEDHLRKGSKIYIEGSLRTRKYQNNAGEDRYTTEVVLSGYDGKLVMLGAASGNRPPPADDDRSYGETRESPTSGGGAGSSKFHPDMDDDIPFEMEWR